MSDSNLKNSGELAGKVAVVTGGARNIGRAIACALAAAGAAVMVNARTSRAEAEQTVGMIREKGGRAAFYIADVTEPAAVAAMIAATVEQFGSVDCLINNAGFRARTPFAEIGLDEWRRVLAIVLDGAFICAQACLPHMLRAGGGSIVNIGGLTGHEGASEHVHVATSKAGLAGMTKALAREFAPQHITVNCVVPGKIDVVRGLPGAPELSAHRRQVPPVGRMGKPEEVAAMVRMLCGPEARYITGQSIHLNGGILMP